MNKLGFPYGGSYYPLVENEANWESDIDIMMEAGITYIRTGEIVNSWDRLQPKEDHYNFDKLDRFFKLCEKKGFKILLGSGSAAPPYWLHQKDNDVNICDQNHHRYPNNATYGWACYNNPTFQEASRAYTSTLVNRYKNSKALMAYQINNEIGYPFMPLYSDKMETYCYCEHCQAEFRDWLKNKYKTLEALTQAWSWSTTTTDHQLWSDVVPPYVKPSSWASITRWLDWRLFHMDVITNQVKREHLLIKSLDTEHPTVVNTFYLKSQDLFGVMAGLDQFEIAKHVDIVGYDLYPGSGNKLETRPEFSSMFFDHVKSVCRPHDKTYWLSEAEGGPIGGWVLGPDYSTNEIDILRNQLETIGHGAKSILYQLFKELPFQPLHWGGIVNLDGSKTSRYDACQYIGNLIKTNEAFLKDAQTPQSEVAIFVSKENQIVLNGIDQEDFLYQELRGVYQYFWHHKINIDFITHEHLESGYAKQYKMIVFPFHPVVGESLQSLIIDHYEAGVSMVLSARFGYMDHQGWYNMVPLGEKFSRYFGLGITNCKKSDSIEINHDDKTLHGYHHIETVQYDNNWKVLAEFEDQSPAALIHKNNKASLIYFATHIGQSYLKYKNDSIITVLDSVINHDQFTKIRIEGDDKLKELIDIHTIEDNSKGWLITTHFINSKDKQIIDELDTNLRIILPFEVKSLVDIQTKKDLVYDLVNGQTEIDYQFIKDEFLVWEYKRKND